MKFGNRISKTYFIKYLVSYIIIFAIPMLVLGGLYYNYFDGILKNEYINQNLNSIYKIKSSVDLQISGLKKIPIQINNDNRLRATYFGFSFVNAIDIDSILANYITTNRLIDRMFLYVRGDHNIYASDGTYNVELFCQIFNYSTWKRESFINDINNIKSTIIRPTESVNLYGVGNARYITCLSPVPYESDIAKATVITMINEANVKNLIKNTVETDSENIIILDENRNVITYLKDVSYLHSGELDNLSGTAKKDGSVILLLGNEKHIVNFVKSENTNWLYLSIIPEVDLMKKAIHARAIFNYGILFIILMASIIIYYFMYLNYSPLKQLKMVVEKITGNHGSNTDEIESVKKAIIQLSDTNISLVKTVEKSKNAMKRDLLMDLLKGKVGSIEAFNEKAHTLHIFITKRHVQIVIIKIQNIHSNHDFESRITEIEESIPTGIEGYGAEEIDKGKLVFVFCTDSGNDDLLKSYITSVWEQLNRELNLQATIGVGKQYDEIAFVGKSYIEASMALDYRFIKGNRVIYFDSINSQVLVNNQFPKRNVVNLERSIANGDTESIQIILDKVVEYIANDNMSLFMARCICYEIINTVLKAAFEIGGKAVPIKDKYPDVLSLAEFQTIEELTEIINNICKGICDYIHELKGSKKDLINEIRQYILLHYLERDFSIQNVSDRFGIALSTLSSFFKIHMQKNIIDYVTELRMEKAKELLKESKESIADITIQIGYFSVSSFINKFKQINGKTPGEYRILYNGQKKYN